MIECLRSRCAKRSGPSPKREQKREWSSKSYVEHCHLIGICGISILELFLLRQGKLTHHAFVLVLQAMVMEQDGRFRSRLVETDKSEERRVGKDGDRQGRCRW